MISQSQPSASMPPPPRSPSTTVLQPQPAASAKGSGGGGDSNSAVGGGVGVGGAGKVGEGVVAGVVGARGRAGAGGGSGAGGGKGQGRRGAPTRFLSILYDMLVAGNPQIWWERETGSVVIEDPQLFEAEVRILSLLSFFLCSFFLELFARERADVAKKMFYGRVVVHKGIYSLVINCQFLPLMVPSDPDVSCCGALPPSWRPITDRPC